MEPVRKFRAFRTDPQEKLWWATHRIGELLLLLRRRRPGAVLGYLVAAVTGWQVYDLYIDYLTSRHGDSIEREVRGNRMQLDLRDEGISRDLFLYGVREQRGTEIFERELEDVGAEVEGGVAIDIGANIGYFALMELNALDGSGEVIAFEPDDRNAARLERNLELNGLDDRTAVERSAIGAGCGTAELAISRHSNLNRLRTDGAGEISYDTGESVTVTTWSLDTYLATREIPPESVVALRMDIEGWEVEAVRGMERLLGADGPLVVSLEVHPNILDPEETRELLTLFDEYGFELTEALTEHITIDPFIGTLDVDDLQSLPDRGPAYNLVLKKPAGTLDRSPRTVEPTVPTTD